MIIKTMNVSDLNATFGSLNTRIAHSAASRDFARSSNAREPTVRLRVATFGSYDAQLVFEWIGRTPNRGPFNSQVTQKLGFPHCTVLTPEACPISSLPTVHLAPVIGRWIIRSMGRATGGGGLVLHIPRKLRRHFPERAA